MDKKAFVSILHKAGNASFESENISLHAEANSLILITAAGQITGTLVEERLGHDGKPAEDLQDIPFLAFAESSEKTGNDSFIMLKNATRIESGTKMSYRYLYVFTDDIIAVTVAHVDSE